MISIEHEESCLVAEEQERRGAIGVAWTLVLHHSAMEIVPVPALFMP